MAGVAEKSKPESNPTTEIGTTVRQQRLARAFRRIFLALVTLFLLVALSSFLGARTSTVSKKRDGYLMRLTYPAVTRPGLAVRWILTIQHPGGFTKQLTVATTSTYFNLFDFNNLDPVPANQTTHGPQSIWVFDPPPGDSLRITMDARLEPAQQTGKSAVTELRIDGKRVVAIHYSTRVMP